MPVQLFGHFLFAFFWQRRFAIAPVSQHRALRPRWPAESPSRSSRPDRTQRGAPAHSSGPDSFAFAASSPLSPPPGCSGRARRSGGMRTCSTNGRKEPLSSPQECNLCVQRASTRSVFLRPGTRANSRVFTRPLRPRAAQHFMRCNPVNARTFPLRPTRPFALSTNPRHFFQLRCCGSEHQLLRVCAIDVGSNTPNVARFP